MGARARPARVGGADRAGWPCAHRDLEDVRPAALGARREAAGGGGAARQEPPLPRGRRTPRPACPPDERRPAALPHGEREEAEGADVPPPVRGGRRAGAHRGREEEARRGLARDTGCARRGSRTSGRMRSGSTSRLSRRSWGTSAASSTRCCATSALSPASAGPTPTRSCSGPGSRRSRLRPS